MLRARGGWILLDGHGYHGDHRGARGPPRSPAPCTPSLVLPPSGTRRGPSRFTTILGRVTNRGVVFVAGDRSGESTLDPAGDSG